MQAEHQHAVLRPGLVERLLQRNARRARLELVLERAGMFEQLFGLHDMHLVLDVPPPEIGLGQRLMQRLG